MNQLGALLAGLVFGSGLVLSGMTQPARVFAFLDLAGDWDPSLALVMAAAIGVYAPLQRLIARRPRPLAAATFDRPLATAIDARLLSGAAIFGVGWGLSGLCPGPAIVTATTFAGEALVFGLAMIAGMLLFRASDRLLVTLRDRSDKAGIGHVSDS